MTALIDTGELPRTLAPCRAGRHDPTTSLLSGELWRATLTPHGPGTLHLDWRTGTLQAHAWGPGADWLLDGVPRLVGAHDAPPALDHGHPVVIEAWSRHRSLRIGATGTLYHDLLPVVLAQRITAGEAVRQWGRLVRALGEAAPGPKGLLLPPTPEALLARPAWWYHPLGVEAKRADALREVARHASKLWSWSALPAAECAAMLGLIRGVGPWTVGCAVGTALGDPDAVAVGDFHLKHLVVHALTGRPRGTDEEMLRLLEPYAGQRGRVVRLLQLHVGAAPAFGPRQRIVHIDRL